MSDHQEPAPEAVLADGVLSVEQAQAFCGLSEAELYRRMADGRLAFVRYGRRRLIPKRALIALLAPGLVPATG
ncbi:MAG: helix-turn-helix domain-containing protein [Gemmataceae bacterium]